eukprot:m.247258 g.247258  ORF g.247258 m.247258 type:complete len:1160 (-) comp22595_c3_seq2:28-3507(-)
MWRALCVAALAVLSAHALTYNSWQTQQAVGNQPTPCFYQACITRGTAMYLYGGLEPANDESNAQFLSDAFWQYNLPENRWVKVDKNGTAWPGCRMAMGSVNHNDNFLLFGGVFAEEELELPSSWMLENDIWEFNSTTNLWHNITYLSGPDHTPAPRLASAVLLLPNDSLLVFGGCTMCGSATVAQAAACTSGAISPVNDMWIFSFQTKMWTQVMQTNAPPARWASAAFFSNHTRRVYVAGGTAITYVPEQDFEPLVENCTWALSVDELLASASVHWTTIPQANNPSFMAPTLVPLTESQFVLLGGLIDRVDLNQNAYVFDANTEVWTSVFQPSLPSALMSCGVKIDQGGVSSLLLYGGANLMSTVNHLHLAQYDKAVGIGNSTLWTPLTISFPSSRAYACAVRVAEDRLVMTGGFGGSYSSNEIWELHFKGQPLWRLVYSDLGNQLMASNAGMVCVADTNGTVWAFGGTNFATTSNELASYQLYGQLQLYRPTGTWPPGRARSTGDIGWDLLQDVSGEAMVLFGGETFSRGMENMQMIGVIMPLGDFWLLQLSTLTWYNLTQEYGPPARAGAVSAVLENNNQKFFVVSGGRSKTGILNDTWMFDFQAMRWLQVAPSPAGNRTDMGYSHLGSRALLVTGGCSSLGTQNQALSPPNALPGAWSMYLTDDNQLRWTELDVSPQSFAGQSQVTMDDGKVVLLGGMTASYVFNPLSTVSTMYPRCNEGQFLNNASGCVPCGAGTYSSVFGNEACEPCPGNTYSQPGAISVLECDTCIPNFCNGHGQCVVVAGTASCACDSGYSGSQCDNPYLLNTVLPSILGSLFFLCLVFGALHLYRRKMSRIRQYQKLQEEILENQSAAIAELQCAWEIPWSALKILRSLDKGASGEVFLAQYDDRDVAVKLLHAHLALMDEASLKEFESETKLMRTLRHRNVTLFYGFGVNPTRQPFLVTEYMIKGSLRHILANQNIELSWSKRMGFALDVAQGVKYLHSRDFLHRDIKSANLLVSAQWCVRLSDFGTARILSQIEKSNSSAHTHGALTSRDMTRGVGTLLWTAPEILSMQSYGLPVDVYSFGCVLYELATRKLPWQEETSNFALIQKVESGLRPRVPEDCYMPAAVELLMRRCWAHEPSQRPKFEEIEEIISRLVQGDVVAGAVVSTSEL